MSADLFRLFSILLLAALLFLPVTHIVWALSSRRLVRKLGRALDQQESLGQRRRARMIAIIVVLAFSYLFHLNVLDRLHG